MGTVLLGLPTDSESQKFCYKCAKYSAASHSVNYVGSLRRKGNSCKVNSHLWNAAPPGTQDEQAQRPGDLWMLEAAHSSAAPGSPAQVWGGAEKLLSWRRAQRHRGFWDRGSLLCQLLCDLGHVLLQTSWSHKFHLCIEVLLRDLGGPAGESQGRCSGVSAKVLISHTNNCCALVKKKKNYLDLFFE